MAGRLTGRHHPLQLSAVPGFLPKTLHEEHPKETPSTQSPLISGGYRDTSPLDDIMNRGHSRSGAAFAGKRLSGLLPSLFFFLALAACQPTAQAQARHALARGASCQPPADLSSLSGVWQASSHRVSRGHNSGTSASTLTLQVDANGHVKGTRSWKSPNHGLNSAGQKVNVDSENVIGLFDHATCRMVLVETAEAGTIQAELMPDGSLSFILSQPGPDAVVVIGTYRR